MTPDQPRIPGPLGPEPLDGPGRELREIHQSVSRFLMPYKFAIEEVTTKVGILRAEFQETYDHSPIEHVRSRFKSADQYLLAAGHRTVTSW